MCLCVCVRVCACECVYVCVCARAVSLYMVSFGPDEFLSYTQVGQQLRLSQLVPETHLACCRDARQASKQPIH